MGVPKSCRPGNLSAARARIHAIPKEIPGAPSKASLACGPEARGRRKYTPRKVTVSFWGVGFSRVGHVPLFPPAKRTFLGVPRPNEVEPTLTNYWQNCGDTIGRV